jgi:aspartoacylase
MGNSLVVYGRRRADLALAAGIQARLGLPIYLHEADAAQTGFLVERWPAGLVIEVGPVPQGLVTTAICRQTQLALEAALDTLAAAAAGCLRLPQGLQVHVHHGSLDLPRHSDGTPSAALHPLRHHRDWQPLQAGDPLFWRLDGRSDGYEPTAAQAGSAAHWPVFINEAAYGEKGIALSLCSRERWVSDPSWAEALSALVQRSAPL